MVHVRDANYSRILIMLFRQHKTNQYAKSYFQIIFLEQRPVLSLVHASDNNQIYLNSYFPKNCGVVQMIESKLIADLTLLDSLEYQYKLSIC